MKDKIEKKPMGGMDKMGGLGALLNTDASGGGVQEIALDLITEDPHQPRGQDNPGFSEASIAELAATIADRGVKSPISVKHDPDQPGRYIINHGARRYRASLVAGKTTIPALVDNDHNEDDQVIENLQREGFVPKEVARFIERKMALGMKKGEIAKKLGKSAAFVSQHVVLLTLPPSIDGAFKSERIQDVTVVSELMRAHKKNPQEVDNWLENADQEITRGSVRDLHEFLDDGAPGGTGAGGGDDQNGGAGGKDEEKPKTTKEKAAPDPEKIKKAIIRVRYKDRLARIVMDRRPPAEGYAWIKYDDDGEEVHANLPNVELLAVVES